MSKSSSRYSCPCGAALGPAELVRALVAYDVGSHLFGAACPSCNAGLELQLDGAHIDWGHSYWAGSMHFEAMGRVRAPGLSVLERPEREAIEVRFGDGSRTFPVPPSTGYVQLRRGHHAIGRTLESLDLEALGVELRGMLAPGYVRVELDRRAPLRVGMQLELFGKLSSRRRAEARLAQGP